MAEYGTGGIFLNSDATCVWFIPIAEPEFINEVYLHPTSHIGGTPMSGRKLTVD
jgi:hypothetical protein